MNIFTIKDKHEFKPLLVELEQSPTSPLARWLLYTLLLFMTFASLWLYFGKVDIVVSSHGKAIPSGEIKIVQSMENSVIKDILVKEGEEVKKNQILMRLDTSINKTNLNTQYNNYKLVELEIQRLTALIENKNFNYDINEKDLEINQINTQVLIYNMTKEAYNNKKTMVKEQKKQIFNTIKANEQDIKRLKLLLESSLKQKEELFLVLDIIAKKDYEVVKNNVIEYQEQIKIKSFEIKQNKAKVLELNEQLKLIKKEYKNKLLEELAQKQTKKIELKTIINEFEFKKNKQFIKSPVDGYIGKLLVHTLGGIVSPAEKLISIISKDAPLIFKVLVQNKDIGFIKEDMNVSVKIDTFNFQKYGLIDAKVLHIADDAIEDEKLGLVYEVFIKPNKYQLEYKNKVYKITIGMSVTAEVKIGKRRVINFFIYPLIRYLDEGMSVR